MALPIGQTFPIAQAISLLKPHLFSVSAFQMFKSHYWVFSTLFCVGVIAGLSYLLISDGSGESSGPSSTRRNESTFDSRISNAAITDTTSNLSLSEHQLTRLRVEGEEYLIAGNFNAAAERFRRILELEGRFSSDIVLRLAMCNEFRGDLAIAAQYYERVIELKPSVRQRLLSVSGLTRCWSGKEKGNEALRMLCGLLLESLNNNQMPEEIRAQFTYQLGNIYVNLALQNYDFDLAATTGVAFEFTEPGIPKLVEMLNEPEVVPEDDSQEMKPYHVNAPVFDVVQRPNDSIELMIVNGVSPVKSLAEITRQLAATCDLELMASPQAQILIQGRSQSLDVKDASASLILDCLLLPLELTWVQEEDRIFISSLKELKAQDQSPVWSKAAQRVHRRFNLAFPGDPRFGAALLARANLSYISTDLDAAANRYQELLNSGARDELLAKLFFNLGKLRMRFGENAEAIQLFFQSVDQSFDSGFQSYGYRLAAQLQLETGDLNEAIKTAGRALSTSRSSDQQRLAAMTMARAYLLNNEPKACNQVLFKYRSVFSDTDLESTASVISSYARLVGSEEENGLNAERHRLLTALTMVKQEGFGNFLDIYITSRAFGELGFQRKRIEHLTLAIESTTIQSWRRQFLFELGIEESRSGRHDQAASIFEFLIAGEDEDVWRQHAMLQLVELYVGMDKSHECIQLGEQLLALDLTDREKFITLTAMGRSYRGLGENRSAALCFLGLMPMSSMEDIK